jgi:hypothetical protein
MAISFSCSSGDSTGPSQPKETLITRGSIGAEGGTLVGEGIGLTVPAAALASPAEIEIYEMNGERPLGENCASPLFRFEGLPGEFEEPLHIRVKYEGTLSGSSFLAVGLERADSAAGVFDTVYEMYHSSDSSGFLVCDIPVVSSGSYYQSEKLSGSTSGTDHLTLFVLAVTEYDWLRSSEGHFYIYYPRASNQNIPELAVELERAWDICKDMGFDFTWPGSSSYAYLDSVHVEVQEGVSTGLSMSLGTVNFRKNKSWGSIRFEPGMLKGVTQSELRHLAGRQLANMLTNVYAQRGVRGHDHWFHYATIFWTDHKFSPGLTPPTGFTGKERIPLKGIADPCEDNMSEGDAAVVEYFAENYGFDAVLQILRRWGTSGSGSERMIVSMDGTIADPAYVWYPEFVQQYLTGGIYDVSASAFLAAKSGSWVIDEVTDTLKVFSGKNHELSANLYHVDLRPEVLNTNAVVYFTITAGDVIYPHLQVQVYRYDGTSLQFLGDGDTVSIEDAHTIAEAGDDLLAAVIYSDYENPFWCDKHDVTLEVSVYNPPVLDFNTAEIRIYNITYDCYEEWKDTTSNFTNHHGASWKAPGQFNGYTFNGLKTWEGTDNYICSTRIAITIDPITMGVTDFSSSEWCGKATYKQSYTIQSVPGMELPFMQGWSYLNWRVVGSGQACSYFDYESVIQGFPPQYDHWYLRCTNPTCPDEDAEILISIFNETPPGGH